MKTETKTQLIIAAVKLKPEKKQDTSAVLYQLPIFFRLKFTTAVCVTVMTNYVFISFSAVQIYDILYIHFKTETSVNFHDCLHDGRLLGLFLP